jgi:hypothetical protein
MAISLSSLTAYVEENRLPLIRKTILDGQTVKHLQLMTGVKSESALNLLDTAISLGNGRACGFSAAGDDTFSQRNIKVAAVKINKSYCHRSMLDYWMNNQVRVAAGDTGLPFEQEFAENVVKKTNEAIENGVWKGVTVNAVAYPGFIQLAEDGTTPFTVADLTGASTVYAKVLALYNAIPADSLDETEIFMGRDTYRALIAELVAKNLYHYMPEVDSTWEFILPGTSTKVVGVKGLDGKFGAVGSEKNYMFAINVNHAFYGTDMQGDEEEFKMWYSQDNDEYRLALAFSFGVQVAFPLENVVASW